MEEPTEELPPPPARVGAPASGSSALRPPGGTRTPGSWTAFAGVVLVVVGLGLWALYRFGIGDEPHSFARGAVAPTYVDVVAGRSYSIGIPGGVTTVQNRKIDVASLACVLEPAGGVSRQLAVLPDSQDSTKSDQRKAENQIATFFSPVTGRVHVGCPGLPAVFVDNAENAGTDWSGTWLLLASVSLAVGLPLLLSTYLRTLTRPVVPQT